MSFTPRLVSPSVPGIYLESGAYYVRPWLNGKRCWRKLDALKAASAIKEGQRKLDAHAQYVAGESAISPFIASADTFSTLADLYLGADCPNARGEPRNNDFTANERARIEWLRKHFGSVRPNDIKLSSLPEHARWRMKQCRRGGSRVVELEWVTLSNVLTFGVRQGLVEFNYVQRLRPRLRADDPGSGSSAHRIRHAREVAPENADQIHRVVAALFADPRSESAGWCWLIACLTGLRRSELLSLRMDAPTFQPGSVHGEFLYVRRAKRGIEPYCLIHPALKDALTAHSVWHVQQSPWYFPGRDPAQALAIDSVGHSLRRACADLELPHFTCHGARSFFATALRSQGLRDEQIAARMGDKTVELIRNTYADRPQNWNGGQPLSFLPSEGEPCWVKWNPEYDKRLTSLV